MKFSFRFASVLKVRRYQKRKEKQKLGMLLNQKRMIEQQIRDLKKKCQHAFEQPQKQSALANRQYYAQKHSQHERLTQLKKQHRVLGNKVEEQRGKLTEAVKKMRMMEKLKEREKRAFVERVEHMEQLQQNEIAIQRYNSDY